MAERTERSPEAPAQPVENAASAADAAGSAGRDPSKITSYRGPAKLSPYGMSTMSPAIRLVDVAAEIEKADELIGTVASSKLEVIARQIRALQEQAEEVLHQAKRDLDLHRATCNFPRRVGKIYHLYEREGGELYWSMLSPTDWGGAPPHRHAGGFRLEPDQSWTAEEQIPARDDDPTRLARADIIGRLLPSG
ncbi:MAG: DUF2452 domain-containing protein [Myxococcota bacterium]